MVRTDFGRRGVPWTRLVLERRRAPTTLNLGRRERASTATAGLTAWALVARRPAPLAAGLMLEAVLNVDLYRLLASRLGARGTAAGLALHLVHQWTALASVPAGIAAHALSVMQRPRRGSAPRRSRSSSRPSSR